MNKTIADTCVIIPVFNEEQSIASVLKEIPMHRVIQVIVVDNNSTDKSAQKAKEHGAIVTHELTRGYGKACLKGVAKAKEFSPNFLIFLDGDYSDSPNDMSLIWQQLDEGHDLVIGSRVLGNALPGSLTPQARFGNWLTTRLLKIFFPKSETVFTDLGPFRGIRLSSYNLLDMKDKDFGWTIEMQVKAVIKNLKCTEVPVDYKKRIGKSKISGTLKGSILAAHKILQTLMLLRLKSLL